MTDTQPEAWIFTFGPVHVHPETGESLRDYYVRIEGDIDATRRQMFAMFRDKWSHQSAASEAPTMEAEYGTRELPKERWPKPREVIPPTVAGNWQEYRRECLPADVSDDDLMPIEAGFIAGAATVFDLIRRVCADGLRGALSTGETKAKLNLIGAEIDRLGRTLADRMGPDDTEGPQVP